MLEGDIEAADELIAGDDEIDAIGMLIGEAGEAPEERTLMCRRVEGDRLVIGEPDPLHDRWLSQLLDEDDAHRV